MKALAVVPVALVLIGSLWLRGPAPAGVTVGDGGAGAPPGSGASLERRASELTTSPAATLYIPTPQAGLSRVLASGATARTVSVEVMRAYLHAAPEAHEYDLLRACYCESRFNPAARGAAGEEGACQVMPRFHGPVPADLEEQFRQAARIAAANGMAPWTTSDGCEEWNG